MTDSITWRRLVIYVIVIGGRRGEYRNLPGGKAIYTGDLEVEIDLWPHVSRKADGVPN